MIMARFFGIRRLIDDIIQFASVQVSCGCSAILALTLGERLYVASAGDSRAVLLRHPQHTAPLSLFASLVDPHLFDAYGSVV
jgi:serine/threonine protein phosphatase PrpC